MTTYLGTHSPPPKASMKLSSAGQDLDMATGVEVTVGQIIVNGGEHPLVLLCEAGVLIEVLTHLFLA